MSLRSNQQQQQQQMKNEMNDHNVQEWILNGNNLVIGAIMNECEENEKTKNYTF